MKAAIENVQTERSAPIDNIGYLSDYKKSKTLRDNFIIPDILKISLVNHRKTGYRKKSLFQNITPLETEAVGMQVKLSSVI